MGAIAKLINLLILLIFSCGTHLMAIDRQSEQSSKNTETAIFAGGCFWCMEDVFEEIPGIISSVSGYTGGSLKDPTYEQVSAGGTGHLESVQVTYDPNVISYEKLLNLFWHNIDPFDDKGQFCDKGDSYRAVIFYNNTDQRTAAEKYKLALEKEFDRKIVTNILPTSTFYPAEDYHQNYARKNPIRYKFYSTRCGRHSRLREVWGEEY